MAVEDFTRELMSHPEYCIEAINISDDQIEIIVSEYNHAQLEIPEFAYGRNIVITTLV